MNRKIINIVMVCSSVLFLLGITGIALKFQELAAYIAAAVAVIVFLLCLKVKSKLRTY